MRAAVWVGVVRCGVSMVLVRCGVVWILTVHDFALVLLDVRILPPNSPPAVDKRLLGLWYGLRRGEGEVKAR